MRTVLLTALFVVTLAPGQAGARGGWLQRVLTRVRACTLSKSPQPQQQAPLARSRTIPAKVQRCLAAEGFTLQRSVDGRAFVVARRGSGLAQDPKVTRTVDGMTRYVEALVRQRRRIRNMCYYLPWEACEVGVADHILTTYRADNGKIAGTHNIAGKQLRTRWWGRTAHVAFDPTARGFILGGDSGPAEAETVAFVAGSRAELGRMLRSFFGGSFSRHERSEYSRAQWQQAAESVRGLVLEPAAGTSR